MLSAKSRSSPVLGSQRRNIEQNVGHVDALAVRERPAGDDLALQMVAAVARNAQPQLAIVQQQRCAGRRHADDLRVGQLHAPGPARRGVQIEPESLAGAEMHPAAAEAADAQLGSLYVGQQADRAAHGLLQRTDDGDVGGVVLVAAVGEIEAEDVGAGVKEAGNHLGRGAGGAQGCHDLGAAVAAHPCLRGHPAAP